MSKRVKEFMEVVEFESLLGIAEEKMSGDWETKFVEGIRTSFDKYHGEAYLSDKQLAIIKKIAKED